jgi:hypothetical protein
MTRISACVRGNRPLYRTFLCPFARSPNIRFFEETL